MDSLISNEIKLKVKLQTIFKQPLLLCASSVPTLEPNRKERSHFTACFDAQPRRAVRIDRSLYRFLFKMGMLLKSFLFVLDFYLLLCLLFGLFTLIL